MKSLKVFGPDQLVARHPILVGEDLGPPVVEIGGRVAHVVQRIDGGEVVEVERHAGRIGPHDQAGAAAVDDVDRGQPAGRAADHVRQLLHDRDPEFRLGRRRIDQVKEAVLVDRGHAPFPASTRSRFDNPKRAGRCSNSVESGTREHLPKLRRHRARLSAAAK
jgi:hypothetical protein